MYVQFFNFLIYILILSQSIYENEYDTENVKYKKNYFHFCMYLTMFVMDCTYLYPIINVNFFLVRNK